jgi:hypothetical protein
MEEREKFFAYNYYKKQVEAWKEPVFTIKKERTEEEFKEALKEWKFDDKE